MVDYEKGTPAWDIAQILTRHKSMAHGDAFDCNRVRALWASKGQPSRVRLDLALGKPCTCGKGDCSSERTTYRKEQAQDASRIEAATDVAAV